MADYKKKTVKKSSVPKKTSNKGKKLSSFSSAPKAEDRKSKSESLKMRPLGSEKKSEAPKQKSRPKAHGTRKMPQIATTGLKLLMGKKGEIQKKRLITIGVVFVLVLSIIIFSVLTPTGPFEYIENKVRTWGKGSFPATISGSELYDGYSVGSVIYTLTDTHAEIFTDSGKHLFSRQHDFNSPVLSVSSQRGLIYDAGGKSIYVYNYGKVVDEIKTANEIYCAEIGRDGTIAVATKSKGYTCEVQVISKGGDTEFIWYSANELVNDITLSNDGERLAVATIDTSGGRFLSKVYVFKYSSATPIHEFEYEDTIVLSLNTLSSSHFSIVTDNSVDFIKWKKGYKTEHANGYSLNLYRVCGKNNIAVLGNKSNNTIKVFGASGKIVAEVDFLGAVSDIYYCDGVIFVLSDGYLHSLNLEGESIHEKINLSGYSRIYATDNDSVIAAGNFGLNKFYLK